MDYHVDLNYNNSTVYNVIDDLATWNEYFETALLYAENNKAPYDVALKYIITHNNATFEQALNICMLVYSRDRVYHIISRMYHKMIRTLNNEKSNMKKGINNNE